MTRPGRYSRRVRYLEVEGVGQPVGDVEDQAHRQRILDLLGGDAGRQHGAHVFGIDAVLAGEFAEQAKGGPQLFEDRGGVQIGEGGGRGLIGVADVGSGGVPATQNGQSLTLER